MHAFAGSIDSVLAVYGRFSEKTFQYPHTWSLNSVRGGNVRFVLLLDGKRVIGRVACGTISHFHPTGSKQHYVNYNGKLFLFLERLLFACHLDKYKKFEKKEMIY